MRVLLEDAELRRFVIVRTLMMSTALSTPVYIALAQRETGLSLSGLGWLMVASGLANAVSASVWGNFSDRSSRLTMVYASALGGAVAFIVLMILAFADGLAPSIYLYAIALFVLSVAHTGVRIGRKTHIVDLAGGDNKSAYVALSNTVIGVMMFAVGAMIGLLMNLGAETALAALAAMALTGSALALRMREVQA